MAICNGFLNDRDKELIEAAQRGDFSGIQSCTPEQRAQIERNMPAVERALHDSMVRCLKENLGSARENIGRGIAQKGGIEAWPTQQLLDEMVKAGQELGVPETEIICTPLICGTGGVIDMSGKIRDVMYALHTSTVPPQFRDNTVFSKIVFVNRQEMGDTGPKDANFDPVTKVLYIYKNAAGVFPTGEALKLGIFPHEIAHASDEFKIKIGEHPKELQAIVDLEKTRATIFGHRDISPYIEGLEKLYREGKISKDQLDVKLSQEWPAECCRLYVNGKCSETTKKFFDKNFSFGEEAPTSKESKHAPFTCEPSRPHPGTIGKTHVDVLHFDENGEKDNTLTVPHVTDPGHIKWGEEAEKLRESQRKGEKKDENDKK